MRAAAILAVTACSFPPPAGWANHSPAIATPTCPASYTITISGSSSRYRATSSESAFAMSHATCNADLADATHLASVESAAELDALRLHLVPLTIAPSRKYYIGAVQMRDESAADVGWLVYSGMLLPANQWASGQPEDAGGAEDNQ